MDFKTPEPILKTLSAVVAQPVQGYNMDYPNWKNSVIDWYRKQYKSDVKEEWLHFIHGIIKTVVFSILALSKPGDNILTLYPSV